MPLALPSCVEAAAVVPAAAVIGGAAAATVARTSNTDKLAGAAALGTSSVSAAGEALLTVGKHLPWIAPVAFLIGAVVQATWHGVVGTWVPYLLDARAPGATEPRLFVAQRDTAGLVRLPSTPSTAAKRSREEGPGETADGAGAKAARPGGAR